jgi:hypothetical protein
MMKCVSIDLDSLKGSRELNVGLTLRSEGDLASAAMFEGGDPEEDILTYGGVQLISGGLSVLI